MEPHNAGLFGRCQNVKGPLLLYNAESKVVLVQGPQKQWLNLSAAQCVAKERRPLDTHSPQPGVLRHKQGKQRVSFKRVFSSSATAQGTPEKKEEPDPLQDKSISLYQRFKKTFRQYGKVLIPVHLITSGVWFGTFYYAALKGVNVVPFLELIGLPDSVVSILKNSQSGNALTAYALFKIVSVYRCLLWSYDCLLYLAQCCAVQVCSLRAIGCTLWPDVQRAVPSRFVSQHLLGTP